MPTTKHMSTERTDPVIKICTCEHAYQDKQYGPKRRVMNWADKKNGFRCTVCARVHDK